MQERLKKIWGQIQEFWNKYTSKQKTIIISVAAAIFFTIVLLVYFLSRPNYGTVLAKFEDNKDATELVQLLDESKIKYRQSRDGKSIYVQEKDYTDGLNLMAENEINSDDFGWNWALTNSMSTTESEKAQKSVLAAQSDLRTNMMAIDGVKDATVYINQPDQTYTLFDENKNASVSIMLELTHEMTTKQAQTIAWWVANAMGCDNTDGIVIMDTERNMLFGGNSENTLGTQVEDLQDYKVKLTNTLDERLKAMILAYGFDEATIGSNYHFNFDKVTERYTEYTTTGDNEQGLYSSSYNYSQKGSSGSGGVPGTASNSEETDYEMQDGGTSDTETLLDKYDYLPNELIRNTEYEVGAVEPAESSISLVLVRYREYNEQTLEDDGTLGDMTFDQFVEANSARTAVEDVDTAELTQLVSAATGIDQANIAISMFEQPVFNAAEKTGFSVTNYLMIILAVLIVALLIFVVFKGTAPVEVTEMEPELSVEQLLATTKENQSLDDIEFGDKSETRVMVEKFVDENPEAVANLLRNWLQDEWG